jgi:hypothetical protein
MNDKELKELQNDFAKLIHKYKLDDTLIVSNKVIVKPNGYNEEQVLSCLFAGLENVIADMITKFAFSGLYTDFDIAYDKTMKELGVVFTILRKRVKQRIEEVKDKNIKYN